MPFASLLLFLAGLRNRSMQSELNAFLDAHETTEDQSVDASAVFKARRFLAPAAFLEINEHCLTFFREHGDFKRWNGFELVAVDGTTLRVPDTGDIRDFFHPNIDVQGEEVGPPLARMSLLYDPLNQLCLATQLDCCEVAEIKQFGAHDFAWKAGQLFLGDRHYDAFWLFAWLLKKGCDFCIRIKSQQRSEVRQFLESGQREQVVKIVPGGKAKGRCREQNVPDTPLKLRLIRVDLPTGEVEVLATSVLDVERISVEEFTDLYHLRWPVEEKFKQLKFRANIENWSGKSALTVFQDIYSCLWACNLTVLLGSPLEAEIENRTAKRKHPYQLNWANALACVKRWLVPVFFDADIQRRLRQLSERMLSDLSPIRPGRKYERNHKPYRREFYMCYKYCL